MLFYGFWPQKKGGVWALKDSCENVRQFILVLFISNCVIFRINNCKPLPHPVLYVITWILLFWFGENFNQKNLF